MILCILFIGHFLSDFFLQSSAMAEKKKSKFGYLLLHCGIYVAVFAMTNYVCLVRQYATYTFLAIGISHFIIDFVRCKIDSKCDNPKYNFVSFLMDQTLHIGIIVGVYYLLELNTHGNRFYETCLEWPNFSSCIMYLLLFTFLSFPSAVFVKKLLAMIFKADSAINKATDKAGGQKRKNVSKDQKSKSTIENANVGSTIGILERIITSTLLLCNQYSAIGLVLTAKSIARFKQLEEKDFAEKYLIGTLSSLLISLLATLIVKSLL